MKKKLKIFIQNLGIYVDLAFRVMRIILFGPGSISKWLNGIRMEGNLKIIKSIMYPRTIGSVFLSF